MPERSGPLPTTNTHLSRVLSCSNVRLSAALALLDLARMAGGIGPEEEGTMYWASQFLAILIGCHTLLSMFYLTVIL